MKEPYKRKIADGRSIFIPDWPVDVALENLATAGKVLGSESLVTIAELNKAAAIVALMGAEKPQVAAKLIKHFICQVRIDGDKIEPDTLNEMFQGELHVVLELFTHVIHSQYSEFFSLGLAKEASPEE